MTPRQFWLAYDNGEVWPVDLAGLSVVPGYIAVIPTHEAAPGYGTRMIAPRRRVYDSDLRTPTLEEAARAETPLMSNTETERKKR